MTEGLKERPSLLRRPPRPAPDETVDPVDYSPTAILAPAPSPASVTSIDPSATGGGGEESAPGVPPSTPPAEATAVDVETTAVAEDKETVASVPAAAPVAARAVEPPAPARQPSRPSKSSKTTNKKSSRREVTFPLSTRVSQDILDLLYDAQEEEGVTLRDAIEQGIRLRWSKSK